MIVSKAKALQKLKAQASRFEKVFEHGTLVVEIYKPVTVDLQKPHTRDEVYIVISGQGEFLNAGHKTEFGPGDFLFVPAGVEHRFENFSDDLLTWVLFYGPEGGEKK